MTAVIETHGLGKRYRKLWALADCTLSIPAGHVVGLVGPNGAGKTTLINLATGMLAPTTGTIEVLGGRPASGPAQLARVGYLAQDAPVYAGLSVADHLRLGAHLNPAWDAEMARHRIDQLDLDPGQKAGKLSGGQRAQLALTLALGKRPELLILDEPVASLDPLARREFLQDLMETVAEQQVSVVLSSHLISDLERVCDYVIVLVDSRVRLAGSVDELLATHHLLSGPRRDQDTLPAGMQVISASHTDRQSTLLVRTSGPVLDPAWTVSEVGLEDLALAYMKQATGRGRRNRHLEVQKTWLTWRQFRAQAITAVAALAAFAILLAVTGPHIASLYVTSGITRCHGNTCAGLATQFLEDLTSGRGFPLLPDGANAYVILYFLSVLVILVAPAIIGVFWGAPLIARELETGTCRLVWNQSITRARWLAVKLTLIGVVAMAVTRGAQPPAGLVGGSHRQGRRARRQRLDHVRGPVRFVRFPHSRHHPARLRRVRLRARRHRWPPHPPRDPRHGRHPGHLRRRPSRHAAVDPPHLIPPNRTIATAEAAQANFWPTGGSTIAATASRVAGQPGAWITSSGAVNATGQPVTAPAACESALPHVLSGGSPEWDNCLASHGIRVVVSYQPVSHYWPLQLAETGLFLALALALAGLCFWRLGRRLS